MIRKKISFRKVISFICLLSIFIEAVPVNALSYGISDIISQEKTQSNSNDDTVDEKSDSDKTANSNDNNEKSDSEDNAKEVISNLEDNMFNAYIDGENELAFSIGFDKKESKFVVKNQSEKQLAKEKLDTIIYKISVYDKESKEKLNIELLGSDTGNTEKLNILNKTKFEIGDTIKITPLDPKNGLKILGDIQGDIDKNKEDYSDGVDNLDYIDNVRFEITETNLKTVYNEAPVFEGLTDLSNVENANVDVLQGVKVTDDHDGQIDNSKIVVAVQEKTETSAILTYTVQDSWGRSTSATRNIAARAKVESANVLQDKNSSKTTQTNNISENIITVEGIPYAGTMSQRFKIKFDTASKSIKVIDEDGRMFSNTEKGDYFKFVLYDKDMEVKTSVTLLGTDKSDSEKLEAINNHLFEDGDYIGIWHAESEQKLKIAGNVKATQINDNKEAVVVEGQVKDYSNGLPQAEISERRFRIKNTGLEEVNNAAPTIGTLEPKTIDRGGELGLLEGIKEQITDDFDTFNDNSLEKGDVSITHTPFDNTKAGEQVITYTATDKWGKSNTKDRTITVNSDNPLDYTYIEFMKNNGSDNLEGLFKIKIDPVKKQLYVDNLENIKDTQIDPTKTSSIFKLKVYTQDGILQKTLNIKGTDKLKTVLRRINGYQYSNNDCIELWSTTPENIRVFGTLKENINGSEQDYEANESTTNGVNNENYKEDYTNGIGNDDYMKNVRFEIGSTNLKYIYNEAPKFNVSTELTAERNGEVDYMDGITASDDYDDVSKNITYTAISTSTIGEKYVEYKVTDSWGRSTITKRKVTVYPYNNLEYNYITIKNNKTNEVILSIKFDDEAKKFKVDKLDASKIPSDIYSEDKVLELKLIKKNRNRIFKSSDSIQTISITKQDLINNNLDNKFESVQYQHGDYLSFKPYDYENGIFISAKSHILLNGFDSEDQMTNSRFEIKPEGLQMTYNNAPEIRGLENTLYLYRGSDLTLEKARRGISVNDDLDGDINVNNITVKHNGNALTRTVNTGQIGNITLTYEVTDSWGRTTSGERTVSIISKSVSNDIEFYDTNRNNKLFSLKYNPISHKFDVTINEQVSARTGENGGGNQNTTPDTDTEPEKDVVFRLNVFNTNGEEVGKLELSEEEISNVNSFNELNDIVIYDDYYFSVWSNTSSRIKIQGDIDGENRLGEDGQQREDYSEGISNNDYMDNVRFKLRTNGLEAVYNKAPEINISGEKLTEFAGNQIDYLKEVTVSDDHDGTIPKEKVKVDKVENGTEDTLVIGNNTVNLSVKDSWGRESNVDRSILITNGIDKNTIRIIQSERENAPNVMSIGFNSKTNKLVIDGSDNQFVPPGDGESPRYVSITIKRNNGNGNYDNVVNISWKALETPNKDNKLEILKGYTFKYGDRIFIKHHHPTRFKIDGKVTDAREDYLDAVQNPENLINTEFEITQSGLKAVYTNPDENNVTDKKVVIGPMAPEKFPFKIQIVPSEKKFKVLSKEHNIILHSDIGTVYKLVHIGSNGEEKLKTEFVAREWADGSASEKIEKWRNRDFEYGDALYIWHKDPKKSIIKGNIENQREDYSNGVDDIDNMNNVVFKLTREGVESVYNEAPQIHGVEDIDVYQGSPFNVNTGVTYTDDYDSGHLTTSVTINNTRNSDGNLDTSQLEEKIVTYTATDRWGKATEVQRKITVRPNLYKNVFKIYPDTNTTSDTKSNIDTRKPAFEIGFDSVTSKYRVFNKSNDRLSTTNPEDIAFGIEIKDSSGNVKKSITLSGNDRGSSPELNKLNEVDYSDGDIIRVYRSNLDTMSISGDVTGDIPSNEQMSNDTNKFDYMMNTGFKVSNAGLKALYNKAPVLNGVIEDKIVSKGETINLLAGLEVNDDKDDDISVNNIEIYINGSLLADEENYKSLVSDTNVKNYTFDELGTYDIDYMLYDSWGRGILKEVDITVESKVRDNEIEVYDESDNLAFKVIFDTTQNKFVLTGNDSPTSYNSSSDQNKYFEMIVRNIKGEEQYKVTLNGDRNHDTEELKKIHEKEFSKYDTIALYGKTANAVKIQGNVIKENNNSRLNNQDYTDGFGNTDKYSKVRFKITDDGLKEMTKKDPVTTGINDKSIKRGEEIDLLSDVVVNVQDDNNEDYKIVVNEEDKNNLNNLKEGEYNVRYTISNSWGYSVKKTIKITVEPRNELEKVKLKLKNTSGDVILTIGFDSIKRKLRVFNHRENATIDSGNTNLAFSINAYDSLGNTLATIELNGTQQIDQSIVDRINNFTYIEGYRLSVWANNPQRHLDLEGNINVSNPETRKVLRNTDHIDKMENGRFEILEDGLTYIYNQAPEIQGGDTAIDYYKGSILSAPADISVRDDHDKVSKNQVVINDDDVDYDKLGFQNITYMVEDTWGRVGTKKGQINIKSSMDSNIISIYPKTNNRNGDTTNTDNSSFDIKFVRDELANKNKIQIEKKSSTQFDSSNSSNTFMNIVVYDANGEKKALAKLTGSDTGQSEKLDELHDLEYDRGDYIAIEGVNEDTKACVRIQGTIVNKKEEYTNGVENIDNIQNVRFKFTDFGLESVYNEAPKIIIDETVKIDSIKGDDIPYMRGVKLRDDHDKLTKDNIELTFNPTTKTATNTDEEQYNDFIKGVAKVGENTLQYKVTDSWGRSVIKTRKVTLSNGILNNVITFNQSETRDKVMDIRFIELDDKSGVVLNFTGTGKQFAEGYNQTYYRIKIYKPGDNGVYNSRPTHNIDLIGIDTDKTIKLNDLKHDQLPYGTIFEFYAFHPDNFVINGPVRNAREDYSDGAQNPENTSHVVFKITDSGLKSIYVERDEIADNENIVSVLSKESVPLKFKIDPINKKIKLYKKTNIELYHELNPGTKVFRMILKGSDGNIKSEAIGRSKMRGNDNHFTETFGDRSYDIGDTLTIWHYTPSRIAINGPIEGAREDYSNGVDNSKNLTEVVFTLTANGLKAVYKEAPKIVGVRDTKVLKGETLNLRELVQDIRATDSIDGIITQDVSVDYSSLVGGQSNNKKGVFVIGKNGPTNDGSSTPGNEDTNTSPPPLDEETIVVPNKVGVYEVQYSVTNSNDRTTRKSSTVVVYDKPTITETNTRIELNSVENTDEAIKERLKKAVSVTDGDDKLYKKETKLEVLSHTVNPNSEGSYTARYRATDMYGEVTERDVNISVTRTINVSVPTTIPFQVVTNLKDKSADSFISGVMKVQNNNTSDVNVYLQSFTRQESTTTKNKNYEKLQIVEPNTFTDWESISKEDSMTKMALGIYNKEGLTVDSNLQLTEQSPLWLTENMNSVKLGCLNRADNLETPYESKLSFTSKHGKNFIGGTSKGKFNLVFRFE